MKEIIEMLLQFNNLVKLHHWKASGEGSYAKHSALGDYYDTLDGQLDKLVETVQGDKGLLSIKLPNVNPDMDVIKASELICDKISAFECESWLKNQLDEIQASMYHLKYKLNNLR